MVNERPDITRVKEQVVESSCSASPGSLSTSGPESRGVTIHAHHAVKTEVCSDSNDQDDEDVTDCGRHEWADEPQRISGGTTPDRCHGNPDAAGTQQGASSGEADSAASERGSVSEAAVMNFLDFPARREERVCLAADSYHDDPLAMFEDDNPFVCRVCGKRYARKKYLNQHVVAHMGEKRHKCDICGNVFAHVDGLNRHRLIHTGERAASCSMCGKRFADPVRLRAHSLIHSGERPHGCPTCQKAFRTRSQLNEHSAMHREPRLRCNECDQVFRFHSQLRRHRRTHVAEEAPP